MPFAAPLPSAAPAVSAAAPRRSPRFASYALLAALTAGMLGGCAIWPDALTIGSKEPQPVVEPEAPTPLTAPSACVGECEKKMEAAQATPVAPASTEPQAIAPAVVEPPPPPPAIAAAKPAILAPGYYINVGLFAVATNGSNVYQKLKAADLPAFTENVETNGNKLTRVRVGAYATRAKADAAAKKIRRLKFDAIVFVKK